MALYFFSLKFQYILHFSSCLYFSSFKISYSLLFSVLSKPICLSGFLYSYYFCLSFNFSLFSFPFFLPFIICYYFLLSCFCLPCFSPHFSFLFFFLMKPFRFFFFSKYFSFFFKIFNLFPSIGYGYFYCCLSWFL